MTDEPPRFFVPRGVAIPDEPVRLVVVAELPSGWRLVRVEPVGAQQEAEQNPHAAVMDEAPPEGNY